MPVILKKSLMNVKDKDGNMHGIDAISDKSIEEKLEIIENVAQEKLDEINEVLDGKIPTKTSDIQNDSGFITEENLSDFYTKTEVDKKLENYVEYIPITIDCKGTDNSTPIPVTISILEEGSGEVYQTLIFNGTPITCRIPKGFAYKIIGSDDLDNYYNPIPVHGEAIDPISVVIKYSVLGVIESFSDVQKVVQVGKAKNIFNVEDQIEVDSEIFGKLQFDIVDFDNLHKESDSTEKTMNLLLHDVIYGYQLGAVQALIACTKGLSAGTYHFKLPTTYGSWVAGDYQFTTTRDIPEGGQLKLSSASGNSTALTSLSLQMYESPKHTTIMESIAIITGTNGIDLGSCGDGYAKYNGVYLNYWQRCSYGSNNYEQSAIDQWLNADELNWWNPRCMFDRPPSYVNQKGFLGQLDKEFIDILGDVCVKTHTNNVYEAPDAPHPTSVVYEIKRKIYLASRQEIFNSNESVALTDGSKMYEYYKNRTQNDDKIKYDHSSKTTARHWWLRTPYASESNTGRRCYSSGALDYYVAYAGYGVVPACSIL